MAETGLGRFGSRKEVALELRRSEPALLLGDFEFEHPEVPETIVGGGAQALVIHKLPGGTRVVDVMGRDDAPITWEGLFFGADAQARALKLEAMRVAGAVHDLVWSEYRFRVIVAQLDWTFTHRWQIRYSITCQVVSDETGVAKDSAVLSEESIMADLGEAKATAAKIKDGPLDTLLGTLDSAIESVTDFANATQDTINSVLEPVLAIQQRVTTLVSSVGNTISSAATLNGLLPNNAVSEYSSRLTTQAAGYTQLGNLYKFQGSMARVDLGVNSVSSFGSGVREVESAGGTLFDTARELYGDATRWMSVGEASGVTDPLVEGQKTLRAPVKPRTERDSIGDF